MIIRAPIVIPVDTPPLKNGAVAVEEDRIVAVGSAEEMGKIPLKDSTSLYLPGSALLPGFVNAHSHLELTSLQDLPYPGNFSEWIGKVVERKPQISEEDYQKGILQGVEQMLRTGTTTVGDHVSFNTDLETILNSPLRGVLFVEVLGVVKEVAEDLLKSAEGFEKIYGDHPRFRVVASPHSAHAVNPEILPRLFSKDRPVFSIHLGESEDEDLYFRKQSGPLYDFIRKRIGDRSPLTAKDPNALSSLKMLHRLNLLSSKVMAVHCNYLDETDFDLIAQNQISVVHCPSSHAYFGHRPFPLNAFRQRGVNIALGTDSLASGHTLSMLDELRLARRNYPEITAEEWVRMATLGGAKALKMEGEIGSLTPGKKADLIAFSLPGGKDQPVDVYGEVLKAERVHFTMIDGKMISEGTDRKNS